MTKLWDETKFAWSMLAPWQKYVVGGLVAFVIWSAIF